MIIHHMSDGSVRKSIEGFIIPKSFEKVYELANKKRKITNDSTSRTIREK